MELAAWEIIPVSRKANGALSRWPCPAPGKEVVPVQPQKGERAKGAGRNEFTLLVSVEQLGFKEYTDVSFSSRTDSQ